MAKRVSRRERLEREGIRRLGNQEAGFRFAHSDGSTVDGATIERIHSLVIPPAWRDVLIARGEHSALQAIGVDSKGRTQYLYHPRYRSRRESEKFLRIVRFAENLPRLRRRVAADLDPASLAKRSVLAAAVRLIDQAFFRLGNQRSAAERVYGLTTITSEHVDVNHHEIRFEFVGKWGKLQRRIVRDPKIASLVRQLIDAGEGELFKFERNGRMIDVRDRHINEYIQSMIGDEFTAKDFRTWAGSVIFATALGMAEESGSRAARKRQVSRAAEATAEILGNTAAVCRSSYICPILIESFMEGRSFGSLHVPRPRKIIASTCLSAQEKALIRFLRQTIADRREKNREPDRRARTDSSP